MYFNKSAVQRADGTYCRRFLHVIPRISTSIYAASTKTVNVDTLSCNNEARVMILECNWVRVVAPPVKVVRVLGQISLFPNSPRTAEEIIYQPETFPFNCNIVYDRIEFCCNPVGLMLRENNGTTIVAVFKGLKNLRRIVPLVP